MTTANDVPAMTTPLLWTATLFASLAMILAACGGGGPSECTRCTCGPERECRACPCPEMLLEEPDAGPDAALAR